MFTSYGITLLNAMLITQPSDLERMNALQTRLSMRPWLPMHCKTKQVWPNSPTKKQLRSVELSAKPTLPKPKQREEVVVEVEKELHALRKQEAVWEAELQRDSATCSP